MTERRTEKTTATAYWIAQCRAALAATRPTEPETSDEESAG